jgi:hypothetical protein
VSREWTTIAGLARSAAAFLDPAHQTLARDVLTWSTTQLTDRPDPPDDDAARADARVLLQDLGHAGFLQAIGAQDLRALCVVREIVAAMSPLADAVVALQGLGGTAIVAADALLGDVDRGFKLGMMTLDRLRPTVGAAACGMAARAIDESVHQARTRRQFGQPIGDFQLIRARLGRMAADLAAARLLVYHAAWLKDRGADRITVEAAMAKSTATEAAQRIVDDAVQIAGGRGVVVGSAVERLYRSVRALRIYEGATEIQHLIIGGALVQEPSS